MVVLVNTKFNISQKCDLEASKTDGTLGCVRKQVNGSEFSTDETRLDCWVQFWAPQHKREMDILN